METETQEMPENSFQQKLHYISKNIKGTVMQIILKQTYDYFKTNNTEMLAFIAVFVFKSLNCKVFVYNKKRQQKLLKSKLLFTKKANF